MGVGKIPEMKYCGLVQFLTHFQLREQKETDKKYIATSFVSTEKLRRPFFLK